MEDEFASTTGRIEVEGDAMPNKTIYVSEEDLPLLERAQQVTGGTLSAAIITALRRLVELEETTRLGLDEITVKVGTGPARIKRFLGTALGEWTSTTEAGTESYAVFQTGKGRYAVHHATSELLLPAGPNAERTRKWSTGWRGWIGDWSPDQAWMRTPAQATFIVADTPEDLKDVLPTELYQAVLHNINDEPLIEDLDI
jgi:EXLDI family protein